MRSIDFLYTFPDILIALGLVAFIGPSLTNAMIAIGVSVIPYYARVTYGVVLIERHKPYFEAGQVIGAGQWRLIVAHLLPNIVPPLIVVATLGFSAAVLRRRRSPSWVWARSRPIPNGAPCWHRAGITSRARPGFWSSRAFPSW